MKVPCFSERLPAQVWRLCENRAPRRKNKAEYSPGIWGKKVRSMPKYVFCLNAGTPGLERRRRRERMKLLEAQMSGPAELRWKRACTCGAGLTLEGQRRVCGLNRLSGRGNLEPGRNLNVRPVLVLIRSGLVLTQPWLLVSYHGKFV